jgi:hypothetical protein
LKSEKGVYSDILIQIDKTESLCRFIVDDFTQFLYSTTADDIALTKIVSEYEKTNTAITLEKVVKIINVYIKKYNRPRKDITLELIQQINNHGYKNFINHLGID